MNLLIASMSIALLFLVALLSVLLFLGYGPEGSRASTVDSVLSANESEVDLAPFLSLDPWDEDGFQESGLAPRDLIRAFSAVSTLKPPTPASLRALAAV
jgi:hypothetical protein